MLSVKSILAELKEDLEEQLPGSTGHINVIRKGFDRPAFLVELEKMTMDDATAELWSGVQLLESRFLSR